MVTVYERIESKDCQCPTPQNTRGKRNWQKEKNYVNSMILTFKWPFIDFPFKPMEIAHLTQIYCSIKALKTNCTLFHVWKKKRNQNIHRTISPNMIQPLCTLNNALIALNNLEPSEIMCFLKHCRVTETTQVMYFKLVVTVNLGGIFHYVNLLTIRCIIFSLHWT